MAGWKLRDMTPNLAKDIAQVQLQSERSLNQQFTIVTLGGVHYDGSGDLTESQLKSRILKSTEEALEGALEAVKAEQASN